LCGQCPGSVDEVQRRKANKLRHWYDIALADYNAILEAQKHRCALCGEPFGTDPPAVDHDHVTGVIRGILHQACNRGLGHFDDNPVKLDQAAHYLRTARTPYNASGGKFRESLQRQRRYHGR
jgi:hypothetical protein